MKPRIAIVTPAYLPVEAFGGPVRSISTLAKIFHRNGCPVTVYTTDISTPSRPRFSLPLPRKATLNGVLVKRYPLTVSISGYWVTFSLFADLLRDDFDIIHAHCARSFQLDLAALVSFIRRKPLIVTPHGSVYSYGAFNLDRPSRRWPYLIHNFILKRVLNRASTIVATSKEEMAQLERFGANMKKATILPNPLDESEFSPLPPQGEFRRKLEIDTQDKLLLFVGRLSPLKGIDILLKAFAEVSRERRDLWLVIVGPDDGYQRNLEQLMKELNCSDRVRVIGPLYGVPKIQAMVDCTLLLMPSRYESFGMTALEAFACGKPVLAAQVGGLRELVTPETGFLFRQNSPDDLIRTLRKIVDDSDTIKKMGQYAMEFVIKRYSTKSIERAAMEICGVTRGSDLI